MAAQRSTSGTLVVNTVSIINFPQYFATISVVHRGTTGTIWLRTDGQAPVILANDNYPVLPGQTQSFPNGNLLQEPITRVVSGTQVQLISDTAIPFTVYAT